jgi:flagellar basal body-associated protein FliL
LLGRVLVGFASTDHSSRLYILSLSLANSLFCIIGFTISGCLAVGNRWRHLAFVGAIVWAASIFNVIFFGFPIVMWMASIVAVAIFALIGGGISLLFKRKTLVEISSNSNDGKFYEKVARELQEKPMVPGLWTKAFAETGGDDAKARALYIKYRVAQLSETNQQQLEEARLAKHQQEKQRLDAIETAKRKARSNLHRIAHALLFIICLLLVLVFGLAGICVIILPFTEGSNSGDSLAGEIGGAIFSLLIALCFSLATKHCYKEMQ